MSADFNPDVLLATARARHKVTSTRARLRLAELGARPARVEDLTADELNRDTKALYSLLRVWKRKGFRLRGGTTPISLPSGRRLVFDWDTGKMLT